MSLRAVKQEPRFCLKESDLQSRQPFDDQHGTGTLRASPMRLGRSLLCRRIAVRCRSWNQLAVERDERRAMAIRQEAVMRDTHESWRKNMRQKTPQELMRTDRHLTLLVPVRVVFPTEGDVFPIERQEAMVADGNAMGIARQIVQHVLGSAEWRFEIDNPVMPVKGSEKTSELFWIGQMA